MNRFLLALGGIAAVLAATAASVYWKNRDIVAITGVTVLDGTGANPLPDAVLLFEGQRILAVGPASSVATPFGATVREMPGKFVIPGLADVHNHLRSGLTIDHEHLNRHLMKMLGWGVTMVFAPAINPDDFAKLKGMASAEDAPYSHFYSSGPMFTAQNQGADLVPTSPDEARKMVQGLRSTRVDAVKLFHDDLSWLLREPLPVLSPEIIAAIVDEAHKSHLKVFVHAPLLHHAKEALRAGVDGLMHGIISGPVDDEFLNLMRKNDAVYVSTLALFESCADPSGWIGREADADQSSLKLVSRRTYDEKRTPEVLAALDRQWPMRGFVRDQLPVVRANLVRVNEAGIDVAVGTDTGLFGVVRGVSSHMELELNVQAGLLPARVLSAATLGGARMLARDQEYGSLEPGKVADFLILDADPLLDIANTRKILHVVKGGKVHDPAELFRQAESLPSFF